MKSLNKLLFSIIFIALFHSTFTLICVAQENSPQTAPSYGIFDSIADWGTPEFPPMLGQYKIPGKVELSYEDENIVYDLFGNGNDIWSHTDEGIYLYSEKTGSWRISAKVEWIHNGNESYSIFGNRPDAGVHIRSDARNSSSTNFRSYLRVGAFGPHKGNVITCWRDGEGQDTRNWWNQKSANQYVFEEGHGIYMRITRIASLNYFYTEWSYDGEDWQFGHGKYMNMPETVSYGLSLTNAADNEMLAHVKFSDVKLEHSPPVAKRFVSSNSYKPNEIIPVMIRLLNTSGQNQNIQLIEPIPEQWKIIDSDAAAIQENSQLLWNIEMKPGQHEVNYTLQAPKQFVGVLKFNGSVNNIPVFGAGEIIDSVVSVSSLRDYHTWKTLFVTAPLVMFIFHMTMFWFNPKLIENLYYSLFLLTVSLLTHLVSNETVSFSDIHYQWQKVTFLSSLSLGMLMLFLYTLAYNKLPLQFWLFLSVTMVFSILLNTDEAFQLMGFYNLIYSIGILECFRIVVSGLRQKKQGFSILAAGIFAYGFAWFWIYMNFFISIISPNIYIIPISTLFMMFCMSIYLSYWFTRLYKNLEQLTGKLEERVLLRTQELSTTNTELEETVTDLAKAKEEAETANQAKSQFLARMSHELRTPLTGLLGMNEILLNTELNTAQSHYLQSSNRAGESLLKVINEILDFSKIESDKMELESVPANINDIVSSVYDSLQSLANQKKLDFNITYTDNATSHWVICDPNRIRQIFLNLVGNAIKFTDKGKVTVSVIPIHEDDSTIDFRMEVQDTGVGIRPEVKDLIFESFAQADETTTWKFGGTGLGLAITKRLVELMGGTIEIESVLGQGSTFIIHLSFQKSESPTTKVHTNDHVDLLVKRKKVLLAEDDNIISKVSREMLTRAGMVCIHVKNGQEAIEKYSQYKFDIILMDYHMPVMDGLEAAEKIREIEKNQGLPHTPIIAVTANVDMKYKDECLAAGMDDLVTKPFTMQELINRLQKWIGNSSDENQIVTGKQETLSEMDTGELPVLDLDAFHSIQNYDNEQKDLLHDIIVNYKNDAEQLFVILEKSIQENNINEIHFHAHKFKSGSGVIGGLRVNSLCKEMEEETNLTVIKEKYELLQMEYQKLLQAVEKEM